MGINTLPGMAIFSLLGIAAYILQSLGLSRLAPEAGLPAVLGWIPGVQYAVIGRLIGDRIWGLPHADVILPGAFILIALSAPGLIGGLAGHILSVFCYSLLVSGYYSLYCRIAPSRAMLYGVSGLLILPLNALWVFLASRDQA